ncbi:unnamed protein product, partial [Coregonus sp. 'balchen']
MREHPPISTTDLASHLERLKANDGLRFSQEYESVDPGQQFTWEHSNLEVNKPKNRYANVIAYDHSRVILTSVDDGYRKQNDYIATQGPLPETLSDFWRMVWEQRTNTIVMMTRLEEKSRVKCDQYWPSRGTETYGMIQVTMLDTVELATYSVRTFTLYKNGSSEKREICQFQFMAWPDHGVPEYPTPTLAFLRRVKACNPTDAGPMAMLERMKHEKSVDIYGHVTCMRAQRNYMVQTEDQYVFIHEALLEAATCGNTEVPARNLYAHIQKLTQVTPGDTVTAMELEFKKLSNSKAHTSRFISASLPCNKLKNRLVNIMPFESTRVCLQPIRGVEGSDYINASFIDGYRYQYFVVDPMAEYNMPQYILREFKVTDARDGQSRTIRQFQFTDWPEQGYRAGEDEVRGGGGPLPYRQDTEDPETCHGADRGQLWSTLAALTTMQHNHSQNALGLLGFRSAASVSLLSHIHPADKVQKLPEGRGEKGEEERRGLRRRRRRMRGESTSLTGRLSIRWSSTPGLTGIINLL